MKTYPRTSSDRVQRPLRIHLYRDKTPTLQHINKQDSMYIDHHISHDQIKHAPDFYEAYLTDMQENSLEFYEAPTWSDGLNEMLELRINLHEELETETQKLQPA